LDRRIRRIGGVEELEEFDELATAVAIFNQGMDFAGEQIDPGQWAKRALAFVLVVARERRINARLGRQVRRRRRNRLDARLLIVGNDRLARFSCRGGSLLFQEGNLAIDAEHLRHLGLKLGVAAFQVVAHLVWLQLLPVENLAHGALGKAGQTVMPPRRSMFARVTGQQPRRKRQRSITTLVASWLGEEIEDK